MRVFYAKYRGLKRNPLVFEPHAAPLGERYSYVPDCLRRNICVGTVTARVSSIRAACPHPRRALQLCL